MRLLWQLPRKLPNDGQLVEQLQTAAWTPVMPEVSGCGRACVFPNVRGMCASLYACRPQKDMEFCSTRPGLFPPVEHDSLHLHFPVPMAASAVSETCNWSVQSDHCVFADSR